MAQVSVVIVSRNEGEHLRSTVSSLRAGLPQGGEIVIVDDNSTDGSADRLEDDGGPPVVRVLRQRERLGVSQARNLGARQCHGDVVVFGDAHIEAPPSWVSPLLEALADPGVGVVGPVISNMDDRTLKGWGLHFSDPWLDWRSLHRKEGPIPTRSRCWAAVSWRCAARSSKPPAVSTRAWSGTASRTRS